jgi:hypothetical protein
LHSRSVAKQDRRYHRSGGSRSVHATSKTLYQCHVCEASFVRDHSLRSHLRQHGIEPTSHSFISALAGVRPAQTLYKVCLVLLLRAVFVAVWIVYRLNCCLSFCHIPHTYHCFYSSILVFYIGVCGHIVILMWSLFCFCY